LFLEGVLTGDWVLFQQDDLVAEWAIRKHRPDPIGVEFNIEDPSEELVDIAQQTAEELAVIAEPSAPDSDDNFSDDEGAGDQPGQPVNNGIRQNHLFDNTNNKLEEQTVPSTRPRWIVGKPHRFSDSAGDDSDGDNESGSDHDHTLGYIQGLKERLDESDDKLM
jgi:hypothetical protein